jgi:hypothetical protein
MPDLLHVVNGGFAEYFRAIPVADGHSPRTSVRGPTSQTFGILLNIHIRHVSNVLYSFQFTQASEK